MSKTDYASLDDLLAETRTNLLQRIGVVTRSSRSCSVYKDDPSQMTGGRLLARYLSRFNWYYPSSSTTDLDQAWAHYEHITLARVYTDEPNDDFKRATPGDTHRPTRLYPLWSTPTKELGDFGISVRLYFSSISVLAAILGLAGILNMPLSVYFYRDSYSSNKDRYVRALRASAVCVDEEYVECDQSCLDYERDFDKRGYGEDGNLLVSKNACNFEDWLLPGLLAFSTSIILIILYGIAFFWWQCKAEIVFDEEMQTASDYSVKVSNPPPDAVDPGEWKAFFETFGHVTACSVAINNADLLNNLVLRRTMMKRLSYLLPPDIDMRDRRAVIQAVRDSESTTAVFLPCLSSPQSLYFDIRKLEVEIRDLLTTQYTAVAVFCTFETERAQRNALHSLQSSMINVWHNRVDTSRFDASNRLSVQEAAKNSSLLECECNNDLSQIFPGDRDEVFGTHSIEIVAPDNGSLEDTLRFRGKYTLKIKEAGEPNDVRWRDLQVPMTIRMLKFIGSTLALLWFIVCSGFFIYRLERHQAGSYYTPIFITVTNILVPKICQLINGLEAHSTEQARQGSLYIKVALFRLFNSAIALIIVTDFTDTITITQEDDSTLSRAVYNLIYAELFTIPVVKLCDIPGFIRKHILAPRARDQDEMNACFIGGKSELAERYTDASKVLFVALFYAAILPESLFLGAGALLIHFAIGKFCLLRLWRPSPDIGPGLSRMSRNYFFSVSILAHVIMCAYFWSGYPYDNLCPKDGGGYEYCNQDFLRRGIFPPLPKFQPNGSEWMSESQVTITNLYSWTAVFIVLSAILVLTKANIIPFIQSIYKSTYEPDGKDQGIDFSAVVNQAEVHGYVPQIREPGFAYPLLVSDISQVDHNLLGWRDPLHHYEQHSLVQDARDITGCEPQQVVFSQIRHWLPTK